MDAAATEEDAGAGAIEVVDDDDDDEGEDVFGDFFEAIDNMSLGFCGESDEDTTDFRISTTGECAVAVSVAIAAEPRDCSAANSSEVGVL